MNANCTIKHNELERRTIEHIITDRRTIEIGQLEEMDIIFLGLGFAVFLKIGF